MSADFFNSAESAVTYASTAAEIILLIRLTWLGLLKDFKLFAIYLAFDAVRTAALAGWNYHALSYEWVWATTVPLSTLLLASASIELSYGLRQPFPSETGNRAFGLYGFLIGMTVSAVASMLAHPQAILRSTVLLTIIGRRCILTGCVLGILAQGAYLLVGGAPLIANWRLHRRILLTYLAAVVIALFASTTSQKQYAEWINLICNTSLFACFWLWTALLAPSRAQSWADVRDLSFYNSLLTSRSKNEESLA
ncbi:MAG: hypothetical protein JO340_17620 [Acidobacteriaceae bacterium]|nr:hypothetical protein [Acidobacteriaceae bacterium]